MAANTAIRGYESLNQLRSMIREPVHRVLSVAESMLEPIPGQDHVELSAHVTPTIDICQTVLALLAAPMDRGEGLKAAAEQICSGIRLEAERLANSVDEIAGAALKAGIKSKQSALCKMQEAATAFRQQADGLTVDALSAVLSNPGSVADERNTGMHAEAFSNALRSQRGMLLVVDDDENNRDVLSRRLVRDGCEVMVAECGRQALRMLSRYSFDLVLLDIMMPDIDGCQVLSEIKRDERLKHLPVIMITAVDDIDTVVRCIEMGADDYLTKPFNRVLLRARVNALLDRKRLRDEEQNKTQDLTRMVAEVRSQRERAQNLLLNILPKLVADELQTNGSVEPMYFEDVTVVFADITGFTLSTEELPADELVCLLHEYFTAFDKIIDRYGLEKLKTIGDCYMYAAGVPERSPSHPVDCVLAALEMARTAKQFAERGPVNWQLRIGINTGPVIAGVVGIRKFAFDIWGDTVNFSARMQATAQPGMVNLASATAARVKDFFELEKQPKVRVKEGREVDTFLVKELSGRLIRNGNGTSPRDAFARRYRSYFQKDLRSFPDYMNTAVEEAS
jgi:adenylate cyclase